MLLKNQGDNICFYVSELSNWSDKPHPLLSPCLFPLSVSKYQFRKKIKKLLFFWNILKIEAWLLWFFLGIWHPRRVKIYRIFGSKGDTILIKMMTIEGSPWSSLYHCLPSEILGKVSTPCKRSRVHLWPLCGSLLLIHIHSSFCLPYQLYRSRRKKS